jgi:glycosyltransferase involved in cell wall biosynthesis
MRIAMLGNRGVPANWGGSDTAVEEIGARLVERGHQVVVYCRAHSSDYDDEYYRGMRRVVTPSVKVKSLDTLSHTGVSVAHALATNAADVMSFNGVGNSFVLPFLKLSRGKRSVVVIDGPDWLRPKWGRLGRATLRNSVWWMVRFSDGVIADNIPIQKWLRERYHRESELIYYGADQAVREDLTILKRLGLEPHGYYLCSGVLTPDKGQDVALAAFEGLDTRKKLVVLGVAAYGELQAYARRLYATNDSRVVFGGFLPSDEFKTLVDQAFVYVHPLRADGSSPALIQAISSGKCVVASSLPETKEILGDAGRYVVPGDADALREAMKELEADPVLTTRFEQAAAARGSRMFDWEGVTAAYERVYEEILSRGR